jgi:predicted RNase H-like HicB family nuclease
MANHIAIVHKDPESDFGVSFPDFPGCITAGANIDEAKDMAQDALALHIQGMLEDGEQLPAPSKLEEIMADPEMTLKQIDTAAKKCGMSRSSFLVHTAQNAIQSNRAGASL